MESFKFYKKRLKYNLIIISAIILIILITLITLIIFIISVISRHYPYVAIKENGYLIYNNEIYAFFGEGYEAKDEVEKIIGKEFKLGNVLGEIKPEKFNLFDYIYTANPIQAIQGDDDLIFIAEPRWQSPTVIYYKKDSIFG